MAEGLYRLMEEDGLVVPVNLGNPHEISVSDLAKLILKYTGSCSSLVDRLLPGDDPKRRRPDIRLAVSRLSWAPKVDLPDGLIRTIEYFRSVLK